MKTINRPSVLARLSNGLVAHKKALEVGWEEARQKYIEFVEKELDRAKSPGWREYIENQQKFEIGNALSLSQAAAFMFSVPKNRVDELEGAIRMLEMIDGKMIEVTDELFTEIFKLLSLPEIVEAEKEVMRDVAERN